MSPLPKRNKSSFTPSDTDEIFGKSDLSLLNIDVARNGVADYNEIHVNPNIEKVEEERLEDCKEMLHLYEATPLFENSLAKVAVLLNKSYLACHQATDCGLCCSSKTFESAHDHGGNDDSLGQLKRAANSMAFAGTLVGGAVSSYKAASVAVEASLALEEASQMGDYLIASIDSMKKRIEKSQLAFESAKTAQDYFCTHLDRLVSASLEGASDLSQAEKDFLRHCPHEAARAALTAAFTSIHESLLTSKDDYMKKGSVVVDHPNEVGLVAFKLMMYLEGNKAKEAVTFFKAAFGAEEVERDVKKRRIHEEAELKIGGVTLVVCHFGSASPVKPPGSGGVFSLETDDVDMAVEKAKKVGAMDDGFAEDEDGRSVRKLKDPFGNTWLICSRVMPTVVADE